MSDWLAVHSGAKTVNAILDLNMSGTPTTADIVSWSKIKIILRCYSFCGHNKAIILQIASQTEILEMIKRCQCVRMALKAGETQTVGFEIMRR
jgi:hypothetical protein